MIIHKQGDILNSTEDFIVQQVNTKGVMGAGLAKQIKEKYSNVFAKYKNICDTHPSKDLLGKVQYIKITEESGQIRVLANIFSQEDYGRENKVYTDYDALLSGMFDIRKRAQNKNKSIAIPYGIGCGLAGGNWDEVYDILEHTFTDYELNIYQKH